MAEQWTKSQTDTKWLSNGMKSSFQAEHGKCTQAWSMLRLNELEKKMTDVVDLNVGTSRGYDRPAPHVLEAVNHALMNDGAFDFPPSKFTTELRQAVAERYQRRYNLQTDAESNVCLTVGASQAADFALRILVNPGDEILLIDPDYYPYERHIRSFQGKVVAVPLAEKKPGDWHFEVSELRKRITKKTKLLIMSNGNNPTGIMYTKQQNEAIAELAVKNNFFVLADHVSELIRFDETPFHNIATIPGMQDRTIVVHSFAKAECLSGFRIGYAIACKEIVNHMNTISEWATDGVVTLGCVAAIAVLKGPQDWIMEHVRDLQKRRDFMVDKLNKMPGVTCGNPKGVYWTFPNIEAIGMTSHNFAEYLLTEAKVKAKPGFWCGKQGEGHMRLAFCVDWEWIKQGMSRMEEAIRRMKK